jgi:peptidoglycan/xylan/chitin deacetylase (PgdA/CDA1 family)
MNIRNTQNIFFLTGLLLCVINMEAQKNSFEWPDGKKAAVCMTYDDGILSHLEHAIPDLNAAGYRGTFYLQGTNLRPELVSGWREAATQGHELGCHSLFHPCSGDFDWVPDEYVTEDYTLRRIIDEMKVMNQFLYAVDGKLDRTYGYPCHGKEVGGISYVDSLSRSGLFTGARDGFSKEPVSPQNVNIFDIPSMTVTDEVPLEKTLAYIKGAVDKGSLAVFCFHGIGDDYMVTSRDYHQQIIDFLKENEDQIWVATMVEITSFLSAQESFPSK